MNAGPVSFAGLIALEPRVLMSGDPMLPQIVVEGLDSAIILDGDASPSDLDGTAFGSVVAETLATRQFTVRNTGTAALNIAGLTLPAGYLLIEGLSATIEPDASDSFTIQLDTSTLGLKSGQITIVSDDADEAAFDFSISATVTQTTGPEISVRAAGGSISIENGDVTPDLADLTDFGTVYIGSSTYRSFVIHNLGDQALKVSNLVVPPWVVLTSNVPGSIAAGASAQFTVRVDTSEGSLQATEITFSTNDSDEASFSFVISARVTKRPVPDIKLVGLENANFGDVPLGLGFNVTRSFTIQNVGLATLHMSDLSVTPGFMIEEGLSTSTLDYGPASDTFTIRVDNSVLGPISGFVTLKTNDPVWGDITFPISANITPVPAGEVEVYGNGLVIRNNDDTPRYDDHTDYGSLPRAFWWESAYTKTFTILNRSDNALNLSDLSVPEGFLIIQDIPASLPPHTTGTFKIKFDTSAPGVRDGFVSFQTDDPDAATYTFRITGVATAEPESEISVVGNGHAIESGDASPSVADLTSFGTAAQGSDGILHTFLVRNIGSNSVQLSELAVPDGFEVVEGMDAALGAMNKDTVTIRMLTGTPGVKSGNVTFRTYEIVLGQAVESTYSFAIEGEVIPSASGNNDQVVSLTPVESTAYESTLTPGVVRVSRTGPVTKALTVGITRSGNATFGTGVTGDYNLTVDGLIINNNRVTIPAGASFVDVLVNPLNDGKPDPFESVTLRLGGGSGYFLNDDPDQRTATVTIEDDAPVISIIAASPEPEPAPLAFASMFARSFATFSLASEVPSEPETDSAAAETNPGDDANPAVFRLQREGNITGNVTVKLSITGTARRGVDYVLMIDGVVTTAREATIPAGDAYIDLVIVPINDALVEKSETIKISVVASKAAYSLDPDKADRAATITIDDNEAAISVEAIDAQASEPDDTQTPGSPGIFRISRTGTTGEPLTVAFTLTGAAKRGVDYVNIGTKATIPAGASFIDVDINALSDAITEPAESVTLKLSKSKTYTIDAAAPLATLTIADAAQLAGVDLLAVAANHAPKTFSLAGGNEALKISTTILNQGATTSAPGTQLRVVLSRDRVIDAADIEMGEFSASLPAMGSKPITLSGFFNIDGLNLDSSALGSYHVLIIVDSGNLIDEVNENNNTFASLWSSVTISA